MRAPVLLASALLLVLGVRIDGVERARSAPELGAAAQSGEPVTLALIVTGYPGIDRRGRPWVAASWEWAGGTTPVVVWCGDTVGDDTVRDDTVGENTVGSDTATDDDAPRRLRELTAGSSEPDVSEANLPARAPPSLECGGADWGPGSRVELRGEVSELDPGGSAAWGMRAQQVSGVRSGGPLAASAARLRAGLRAAAVSTPGANLVPGLAVGDTALVSQDTDQQMRDASLTHLVAVSGANCALVTSAMAWVLGWCGAGRRLRILGQGGALAGFVFVVGPDPSVQRAAVMAVVVLVSGYGGKRAVALPALGAAVVVLLVRDPWQALHPGFALSVAATAGILLAVPTLRRVLVTRLRVPRSLALPVAVAGAAQLACGPLLLLIQPGLPAVGVLANVLAAPAAPLGTGMGLLALVLLPVVPALGAFSLAIASWAGRWLEATAAVTSALPGARLPWPEGWAGALLLAGAELSLALAWWVGSGRADRSGGREPWLGARSISRRGARWGAGLAAIGVGALLGPTLVTPLTTRATTPGGWSVVVCDVGQGDALLLRDPAEPESVVLVDTGDDPAAITECLARFGVGRIAVLVISHDHQDHLGALGAVVDRVDRAIVAPAHREAADDRPLLRTLMTAGVPVETAAAGDAGRVASSPGSPAPSWRVLGPPAGRDPANANASSLVLRAELGAMRVLLLGDTGAEQHAELLRREPHLSADVVKVAHHGSGDQDPELLPRIGAELALISVGADNRYGHPARKTLEGLASAGTRAVRTDKLGHIAVSGEPGDLRIWGSGARPAK